MNKKLIALALAGVSIAPAAMAQTANPVTLYGRIYVMFESVEAKGGTAAVPRRNRVSDQSSLLGVRGTEDLGGGLKGFFQLETAFRPDSNATTFAARNSGVGLQGGWGSIVLGRWDTPFKSATTSVDPFGDLTIAGITSALNDRGNFDRREQNVVQYWSPTWAGFAAKASYAANEAKTATANADSTSYSVTYSGGPIYAFGTYEEHKDQVGTTQTAGSKEKGTAIGGAFTMGAFKLGGEYEEFKKTGMTKQKSWMASLVWTAGKHQLIYQHQNSKDGLGTAVATQPDCDVDSLGYQYNFTKRTFFLAQYTKTDNNAAATCNFGSNALAISAGQDPQGFAVGLRHVF